MRRRQTSYAKADRKQAATTATTTDCTIDCADEANMTSKAGRQPSPRTRWCPDLRAWQLR